MDVFRLEPALQTEEAPIYLPRLETDALAAPAPSACVPGLTSKDGSGPRTAKMATAV